jgi:hypothetical protein
MSLSLPIVVRDMPKVRAIGKVGTMFGMLSSQRSSARSQ